MQQALMGRLPALLLFFIFLLASAVPIQEVIENAPELGPIYASGKLTLEREEIMLRTRTRDDDILSELPDITSEIISLVSKSISSFFKKPPQDGKAGVTSALKGLDLGLDIGDGIKKTILDKKLGFETRKENMLILIDNAVTSMVLKDEVHPYSYRYLNAASKLYNEYDLFTHQLEEGKNLETFRTIEKLTKLSKKYLDEGLEKVVPKPRVRDKASFGSSKDFLSFYLPLSKTSQEDEENYRLILQDLYSYTDVPKALFDLRSEMEEDLEKGDLYGLRAKMNLFYRLLDGEDSRIQHLLPPVVERDYKLSFHSSSKDTVYALLKGTVEAENINEGEMVSEILLLSPPFMDPSTGYTTPHGLYTTIKIPPLSKEKVEFSALVPYAKYYFLKDEAPHIERFFSKEIDFNMTSPEGELLVFSGGNLE
jgi:hypothetical protein